MEAECEAAEQAGDDAVYQDTYQRWEVVEENIARLEAEMTECNSILQEKYYQQRVATAQSGRRPTASSNAIQTSAAATTEWLTESKLNLLHNN